MFLSMAVLRAESYASLTNEARSAPEKPSQWSESAIDLSYTFESRGSFLVHVLRMEWRSSLLGSGTYKSLSKRPGRSIAGSMISGLLVAAMTNTPVLSSRPSSSVKS